MGLNKLLRAAACAAALIGTAEASAQTLTMGVRAGPESMDPHYSALGVHAEALRHVYDTLVKSDADLDLVPGLAVSWEPVADDVWEFKLREGVTFHDGSDFTAEDVKFSFDRIPDITGPNPVSNYTRQIKEMKIVDDHTIQMVTDGPAPTLPNMLVRFFIVSSDAAAGLTRDNANETFNSGEAAIGTGPYKYVSWTPKDSLVLERFEDHWGGAEPWEKVVRKEIATDATRVAQLRAGQVDMISAVPATDIAALSRSGEFDVVTKDTTFVFLLDFDLREDSAQISAKDGSPLDTNPFLDPRVREAIDLAIDRQALAEIVQDGMGTPASQLVAPSVSGYNPDIEVVQPNIERARALLAEAGYPDGFKFTLSFTVDRLPGDRDIGTTLVQMLAAIGIEVEPNGVPVTILFSARPRGELSATMAGWSTLTGEAGYTYTAIAHSNDADKKLGQFNWRLYKNEELDALLESAMVNLDEAERSAMYAKAAEIFTADRVTLPLTVLKSAWAVKDDTVTMTSLRSDEETLAMDAEPVE